MKILVLGATGGTGIEIVRQSMERGHEVTALVRSPERLRPLADKLRLETGNLLDPDDLAKAIRGQDAVLSAFGPRVPIAKSDEHLLRDFATALVAAMKQTGVRRVIVESAAFLFTDAILPPAYLLGKLLFPAVVRDQADLEGIIMNSQLDWTVVRPPRLTNNGRTGKFRMRYGHLPVLGFSVARADVAECFLKLLSEASSVKQVVGVSN